jgi:hypothetical protein
MTKYFLIILAATFIYSCGKGGAVYAEKDGDSTAADVDTLVSDVNWGEEDELEEEPIIYDKSSSGRSGGGAAGGAADSDADVIKYQNWQRDGDSPKDFANAIIYPAIRMVYSDNFAQPKASVLNSTQDGDRHTIEVKISWKDHWTPKYTISGVLEVNSDGSAAKFTITDKNVNAEALELTEDNFKKEIVIPSI